VSSWKGIQRKLGSADAGAGPVPMNLSGPCPVGRNKFSKNLHRSRWYGHHLLRILGKKEPGSWGRTVPQLPNRTCSASFLREDSRQAPPWLQQANCATSSSSSSSADA